jgi:membrane protein required for colicin V production
MVSRFIDRLRLKEFDRQIGALFGFTKGILLCVIITLFAVALLGDTQRKAIVRSRSGYYIAHLLDRSQLVMPREISDVLQPYIHSLDERLDDPPSFQPTEPTYGADAVPAKQTVDELLGGRDSRGSTTIDPPWRR